MKRILIDLDVVVIGIWANENDTRKKAAHKFIQNVRGKKFIVITPTTMLEVVSEWKDGIIKTGIIEFYTLNTDIFIEDSGVIEIINSSGNDFEEVSTMLMKIGIKDGDVFLVLAASAEKLDYLITFNRKHLTSNELKINGLLRRYGLNEIRIVTPEFFE